MSLSECGRYANGVKRAKSRRRGGQATAAVVANAAGACAQNRCALIVGANRITTTVTTQDGATRSYVVTVTRAASRVEALSELVSSHAIPQR
jgi:hypothetical protein